MPEPGGDGSKISNPLAVKCGDTNILPTLKNLNSSNWQGTSKDHISRMLHGNIRKSSKITSSRRLNKAKVPSSRKTHGINGPIYIIKSN